MRLFIAVDLPNEIKSYCKKIQNKIETKESKISFTKDFHITLKFLGYINEKYIPKLKERLSEVKFTPFKLKLDKVGVFPSETYVKVVWIGVEPQELIKELQQKVEKSVLTIFSNDSRFESHITLARIKYVKNKKSFIDTLKNIKVERKEFDVGEFKLVKSTLTGSGAIHDTVETFPAKPKVL